MSGSNNNEQFVYDGVLRKPFLAEHWHKGFAAALGLWLPFLWIVGSWALSTLTAVWLATILSVAVFTAVATYHEGFALDNSKQSYRLYTWVAGMKFGTWQPLPAIAHVTVRPYIKQHYLPLAQKPVAPVDTGLFTTERGWQVLLSVTGKPIGITAAIATHEKALLIAGELSQLLSVPINKVRQFNKPLIIPLP